MASDQVCCQLILLIRVTVGEAVRLDRSADRICGVGSLAQNVATQIIGIHPDCACAVCRDIIRVIRSNHLPQHIIAIVYRLASVVHAQDILLYKRLTEKRFQ